MWSHATNHHGRDLWIVVEGRCLLSSLFTRRKELNWNHNDWGIKVTPPLPLTYSELLIVICFVSDICYGKIFSYKSVVQCWYNNGPRIILTLISRKCHMYARQGFVREFVSLSLYVCEWGCVAVHFVYQYLCLYYYTLFYKEQKWDKKQNLSKISTFSYIKQ